MADDARYPVGKFTFDGDGGAARRANWIEEVAEAPARLRAAVAGLDEAQLAMPYREGGWTLRQVVHHVPDSHMNAYVRFKLALTEAEPTIKPYDQSLWAELVDGREAPVETSLTLLAALHERWLRFLRAMSEEDFARGFRHPESGARMTLAHTLALYAWHGRHHTAQITGARARLGWSGRVLDRPSGGGI